MFNEMVETQEEYTDRVLRQARRTYGTRNQILVSIEELNELACVLAKYPRYDRELDAQIDLYEKALDEVADVEIVLNHVKAIMSLSDQKLNERKLAKLERLERWLSKSDSMQMTTEDRKV